MTKRETNRQLDPLTLHELTAVLPIVMGGPLFSPTTTEIVSIEYVRHEGSPIGWEDGGGPDGECGNYIFDDSQSCGEYEVTLHHHGQTYDKSLERVYFKCSYLREVLACGPARIVCQNTIRLGK